MTRLHLNAEETSSGRYSKRKRTQVKYYESESEAEEIESAISQTDDEEHMDFSQPKKRKAQASRPLPKHKIFPFLRLPAEIRNSIYGYCLMDPQGIYFVSNTVKYRRTIARGDKSYIQAEMDNQREFDDFEASGKSKNRSKFANEPRILTPSLLAVNKQIFEEGHKILYGNSFHAHDPLTLHSFLVDVGHRAALMLKNVTLRHWRGWRGLQKAYNHVCFTALMSATNLEKFTINGPLYCKSEPASVACHVYRQGFPWLEAVGAAKGRYDAALDILEITGISGGGAWFYNRPREADRAKDREELRRELRRLLKVRLDSIKSRPGKTIKHTPKVMAADSDEEDELLGIADEGDEDGSNID